MVRMSNPIEDVLARVNHTKAGDNQWDATCPCRNDDENPSLRISVGAQNQVLMKCMRGGGCDISEICKSIDLDLKDLFPKDTAKPKKKKLTIEDTYKYFSESGELVMEVLRYRDSDGKKTFRQRQPDGNGGWNWSTSGLEKPLYRLPQVMSAKEQGIPIYVVEGEKDVHSLESLGKVATTNPGGAGAEGQNKWTTQHTASLAGAKVIIICDNDEAGYLHARSVHKVLTEAGSNVKVFKPGKHKDISDLIEAGEELAESLVPFEESAEETSTETDTINVAAIDELITSLEQLKTADASQGVILGKASSSFDKFLSDAALQHRETGNLVEWSPFLEMDVDLSYDWVIPNVLERQECVIVVAAEGAGKTTLARQVALMASAGIHPFLRSPMKPVRTLMIDLENPERIIRRTSKRIYDKIKWFDQHKNMDAHLLMKPDGVNLLKAEDRAMVEEYVASVEPDILFFGPLYKSFLDPGGRTAESVSIEIARFLDYIRHTYNCALWIEHHAPLGSGGQRDLRPFGSAVWSRWSEFGIALAPDPTDPQLIEFRHYRGQREAREWPELCKRGDTWPFEVIEFAQYSNSSDQSNNKEDENEEFDEESNAW